MSYAKLIVSLPCTGAGGDGHLPAGTEIKSVHIKDGAFHFLARTANGWNSFFCDEDLPAFTDKGSERREKRATLKRGRPRTSSAPSTKHVSIKLTPEQHAHLVAAATLRREGISDYVRATLILNGMPE